jgi:hypothetical protein
MANLLALSDVPSSLRTSLTRTLRATDEALILPSAYRCDEVRASPSCVWRGGVVDVAVADATAAAPQAGTFKNVVFKLSAKDTDVPHGIFSPNWYSGMSFVRIDTEFVESLLADAERFEAAKRRLAEAIPSENHDNDVDVRAPRRDIIIASMVC